MINKVILSGRITRDIEIKTTQSGTAVAQFSLAVERSFAKQGEEKQTDFITCVAWGKTAEFVGRYFGKGRSIVVIGQLRTRTYEDKNGSKHYVTEVYADEVQFTFESKTTQNVQNAPQTGHAPQGYNNVPAQYNVPQTGVQTAQRPTFVDYGDIYNDESGLTF